MSRLKPLQQSHFQMKLIKDLGIIKKARYAIFECSICQSHNTVNCAAAKRRGINKCKSCSGKLNAITTHGETKTKLYRAYHSMKNRCSNVKHPHYKDYGGRGIIVSEEFDTYEKFRDWSLLNGHKDNLSIDRINNNGNYEPSNCRWTNMYVQACNRRGKSKTGYIGITMTKDKKYLVEIMIKSKNVFRKRFTNINNAVIARNDYIIKNNLPHVLNELS